MFSNHVKNQLFIFVIFIATGCGPATPSSGNDPNKPLPLFISDKATVLVNSSIGAIITTPDGRATLSISPNVLSANTSFEIAPYTGPPRISIDQMYYYTPVTVATLIAQQELMVSLVYDLNIIPTGIQETDLRLGVFDTVKGCWSQVFFDSPPNLVGHKVNSKDLTHLGVFGVTVFQTQTCPNSPTIF